MTSIRGGEGSIRNGEWGVDQDPTVGGDAMRWRPEAGPCVPFLAELLKRPTPMRPAHRVPSPAEVARARVEANALWLAIGDALRELPG